MSQFVLGTAGHIDHGKTSLVKNLTGINTDKLNEEKDRGMTIDLGFAYLNDFITIIDVPGHEKFIRNMSAGAASIHFGLIVVAADDGVMPQTREHIDILTLLGVTKGWVAITKKDLVMDAGWIELIELDLLECLNDRGFYPISIHYINNQNGNGIESLKKNIIEYLDRKEIPSHTNFFRMNVDRFFSKKGFGTVVTGTVINGDINVGDEVEILPSRTTTKIRGLHSHGFSKNVVTTSDRAAINLSHVKKGIIFRGSVVCSPGIIQPTKKIIAHIKMVNTTKWFINNKQRLRFHFGTRVVLGRVNNFRSKLLKQGESSNLVINLESNVFVSMDDYFVIRSYSPMNTIAGGFVLFSTISNSMTIDNNFIESIPLDPKNRFFYFVEKNWRKPNTIDEWKTLFFNSSNKIDSWKMNSDFKITEKGYIYSKNIEKMAKEILIQFFHDSYAKNPFRLVLSFDSICKAIGWSNIWLEIVGNKLEKEDLLEHKKGGYSMIGFNSSFSEKDLIKISNVENIIKSSGMVPVTLVEIIQSSEFNPKSVRDLIHNLLNENKIICMGNELYVHNENLKIVVEKLKDHFSKKNRLSIGDFKEITGLTRKTAIPFLEYLDMNNFTVRSENYRSIGGSLND